MIRDIPMIKGTIYKITCIVNGKCYIGQTHLPVETRWQAHLTGKGSQAIRYAVEKYGVEMFKFEVVHSGITCRDVLNQLEIALIAAHDSYNNGYNDHPGGQDEYRYSEAWEHAEEICRLYVEELKTMDEIAAQFNTSKKTIFTILKVNKVECIDRRTWRAWQSAQEIGDLYVKKHKSTIEIAEFFNVSDGTITAILKANGIKPRQIGRRKGKLWKHSPEICQLYTQELLSLEKIAARFQTNHMAIKKVLKGCGITLRKYSPRKSEKTYHLLLDL